MNDVEETTLAPAGARPRLSMSTRRHYAADFRRFESWCRIHGVSSVPATVETIRSFVRDEIDGGYRPSTVGRRLASIAQAHSVAGLASPTDDPELRRALRASGRTDLR